MATTITMQQARAQYRSANTRGRGYAPDFATIEETVADLVNNYEGEILHARHTSDDVAVVRCGDGEIVAIGGDAAGGQAWAVKFTAETERLAAQDAEES